MIINITYAIIWAIFAFAVFKILLSLRIERFFKQGQITEIRIAYILLTFTLSYLSAEALMKLLSLMGLK